MYHYERLKYAVGHDPCLTSDRRPFGAVVSGTRVHVLLRIDHALRYLVTSVDVVIKEYDALDTKPLESCDEGYRGDLSFISEPHVAFYWFALTLSNEQIVYYVPRADDRATAGELVVLQDESAYDGPGFQVTVYEPYFETQEWISGAVMYQIFPDRFARGEAGVRKQGIDYHRDLNRPVRLHDDWNEPVEWLAPETNAPADSAPEDVLAARMKAYDPIDFYGGTLAGIREKLSYLASLGVEVLYLNPIFEARSNHRYDTADYERIEPLLGDEHDLELLVSDAHSQGISIILDAVLSHTGADSRYFNGAGAYNELGAAQSESSPYHSWFDFSSQEDGAPYRCWWGHPTLPEVNERDASWQRYMTGSLQDDDLGVLGKWIASGVRGYRLDVADEIPDDVLERIRTCVKRANPDAAIIGEVWEDPTTKSSYGAVRTYALGRSLDSVMNYPLRDALIGFALEDIDALQLATFLKHQHAHYPQPLYRCLMNLLSSHDIERMRSVLSLGKSVKQLQRDEQHDVVAAITQRQDKRGCELQRLIVGLLYALPGVPCLYYGDEVGLQGGGDPFCRATHPWDADRADKGADLTTFYQMIGTMRKGSEVLKKGLFSCCAPHEDVVCIIRALPERSEAMVVVANRSAHTHTVVIDVARELPEAASLFEGGLVRIDAKPRTTMYIRKA